MFCFVQTPAARCSLATVTKLSAVLMSAIESFWRFKAAEMVVSKITSISAGSFKSRSNRTQYERLV